MSNNYEALLMIVTTYASYHCKMLNTNYLFGYILSLIAILKVASIFLLHA